MKLKTVKGFTLAELLIVMAIIVVLAAVAIPTFGKQLETSRETGDMEIIRNAYTEALTFATQDGVDGTLDGKFGAAGTANTALGAVNFLSKTSGSTTTTTYTVKLEDMGNAKFAQSGAWDTTSKKVTGSAWTYVSDTLMGKTVPAVSSAVTYLTFTFKFDDNGEVVIDPATVDSVNTCLFAPATTLPT